MRTAALTVRRGAVAWLAGWSALAGLAGLAGLAPAAAAAPPAPLDAAAAEATSAADLPAERMVVETDACVAPPFLAGSMDMRLGSGVAPPNQPSAVVEGSGARVSG